MSFIKSKKFLVIVLLVVVGVGIMFLKDDNASVLTEVGKS
ncbi:hypothetical protein GGGNBK_01755 [Sporosarcina sp. ANT_H38]